MKATFRLSAVLAAAVLSTGCQSGLPFFTKVTDKKISAQDQQVEILKPKTSDVPVIPTGYSEKQAPANLQRNEATGQFFNPATGEVVRGNNQPLPGEAPLPANPPQATVKTSDGIPVSYIQAGNSIFVETKGLKPDAEYTSRLVWPNGKTTEQPFKASAGGNIATALGNFLEFPHVGFHQLTIDPAAKQTVVTGQYKVELIEKGQTTPAQTIYFAVRTRPVLFIVNNENKERSLFFSDYSEELYLHGEGFPADTLVNVWVVQDEVNRLHPLADGADLAGKVFENLKGLRFKADANGVIHTKLLSWGKRTPVEQSLVVIGKYLNDEPKFNVAEDIAIVDHPTFVIKDSKTYFSTVTDGAVGVISGEKAGSTPTP